MSNWIKSLKVQGLHGRLDLNLKFSPEMNILYGRNGSGKTTVLHILANAGYGSIHRFAFLSFKTINIVTGKDEEIRIERKADEKSVDSIILFRNDERLFGESIERCVSLLTNSRGGPAIADSSDVNLAVEEYRKRLDLGQIEYFPAFRAMIEAWGTASIDEERARTSSIRPDVESMATTRRERESMLATRQPRRSRLTVFARELFGNFVPAIRFPSPIEIERELRFQIQSASYSVADTSQSLLSEAFVEAFTALSASMDQPQESPETIVEEIRTLLDRLNETELVAERGRRRRDVYFRLRNALPLVRQENLVENAANVLSVYKRALQQNIQIQEQAYRPIERYIEAVNEFLENKRLIIIDSLKTQEEVLRWREAGIAVQYEDKTTSPLASLSSGERHIMSMLYAATHSRGNSLVLIDEPEISLHIDWQRRLMRRMMQQLGKAQVIVCTHSPEIGADFPEKYQEVRPIQHTFD